MGIRDQWNEKIESLAVKRTAFTELMRGVGSFLFGSGGVDLNGPSMMNDTLHREIHGSDGSDPDYDDFGRGAMDLDEAPTMMTADEYHQAEGDQYTDGLDAMVDPDNPGQPLDLTDLDTLNKFVVDSGQYEGVRPTVQGHEAIEAHKTEEMSEDGYDGLIIDAQQQAQQQERCIESQAFLNVANRVLPELEKGANRLNCINNLRGNGLIVRASDGDQAPELDSEGPALGR